MKCVSLLRHLPGRLLGLGAWEARRLPRGAGVCVWGGAHQPLPRSSDPGLTFLGLPF